MSAKRFRCRIGLHVWYSDNAIAHSVHRCNYCPAVDNEKAAALLDAERKRISALPADAALSDVWIAAYNLAPFVKGTGE